MVLNNFLMVLSGVLSGLDDLLTVSWECQCPDLNLWGELKRTQARTCRMIWRFCKEEWSQIPFSVFCNLVRFYGIHFIGKGRLCKVLNAGVPIIVAHVVLLKIIISKWGIEFSQKKLKVGFFSSFQCEIKLIHQMVNVLYPFLLIFTRGCSIDMHIFYWKPFIKRQHYATLTCFNKG